MKIAVINFSGNVGKSTIARHLLLPRVPDAELIAIESVNADEGGAGQSLRGRQFGALQEYMQTVDNLVVDIGASNVEDLLDLMRRYQGSHEDFDCFLVPTVAAWKQQRDTIATLVELSRIGVPSTRLKVLFNMVEYDVEIEQVFAPLLAFLRQHPIAIASTDCVLHTNEIYTRIKDAGTGADLAALILDTTDYKTQIVNASDIAEKVTLAQALATRRLAMGILPEHDACFAALKLEQVTI